MSILDLFCSVDAFWQRFEPLWEREQLPQANAVVDAPPGCIPARS